MHRAHSTPWVAIDSLQFGPAADVVAVSSPAHDPSSSEYSVDDILQIILKTRKSWKTLRGQSEAVWPPFLEATMLKALQEYEPRQHLHQSQDTRMVVPGRYPLRNRFISDYIHRATGKYRSAKQVGSRLQQLRDTPEGRNLIDVLTGCYRTRMVSGARVPVRGPTSRDNNDSSSSPGTISCDSPSTPSSSASPATPSSPVMPRVPQLKPRQPIESRMPVYIDILPHQPHCSSMGSAPHPSNAARLIWNIDPTVTFVSPCSVTGKSSYIVLLDGAPVHSEDTMLEYVGPYFPSSTGKPPGEEPALYGTTLAPKYWDVICRAADPTLYSIVQDVYRLPDPAPNQDYSRRLRPVRIFSAIYYFRYSSVDVSSGSSCGQPSTAVASSSSSMTSASGIQTLQGSVPANLSHPTLFRTSSNYSAPITEGPRPTTEAEQNQFDEPFMLDVNFDQIAFDDFIVNMSAGMENASSSQLYPDTFYM